MPNRTVEYRFRANFREFTAGLSAAGRGVQDLGGQLTALDKNGAKMRGGLDEVGRTAGRVGLVAAAGLGSAVLAAANFDSAMSKVDAATHETAGNMDLLREAAIQAGADTQYSASEAAAGIEELAKAGVETKDILAGGLSGALSLAAAGELDVAKAAEIAATAMTQFKLGGDQVNHVADLLAAGAGKAQGGVTDLGAALQQSGLVAAQTGLSIEETVGTLAEFASAGLIGSDAGTSFKTMLQALTPSSDAARTAIEKYNLSAYDSQGNFIGMTEYAGKLKAGLKDLSVEQQNATLKTIFGSDAVRAAAIIFSEGAEGAAKWQKGVNDAGYAADTAARKMDNLKGDVEQLKGSFETLLITSGEGSQSPLRGIVQGATDATNALNGLPAPIKNTAVSMLAITAITGGALWFGSKVIQGIANTKGALDALGPSGAKARGGLALATKGIAALSAGFIAFEAADSALHLSATTADIARLTAVLDAKAGTDLSDQIEATEKAIKEFQDTADNANIHLNLGFTDIYSSDKAAKAADTVIGLKNHLKDLQTQQEVNDAVAEQQKGSTDSLTASLDAAGQAAASNAQHQADLTQSMVDARSAALGAFDAETQYRQALKDSAEQAASNNAGIDGNTKAALENRDSLSQLASAWNNQSDAVRNNVVKQEQARQAFIKTATGMGVPIERARVLAARFLEIPDSKIIPVSVVAGQAYNAIRNIRESLASLKSKNINVSISTLHQAQERAAGGPIYGPGTATSDSIPAMLSNGEYVVRAEAVKRYGMGFFDAANRMKLAEGGSPDVLSRRTPASALSPSSTYSSSSVAGLGYSPQLAQVAQSLVRVERLLAANPEAAGRAFGREINGAASTARRRVA